MKVTLEEKQYYIDEQKIVDHLKRNINPVLTQSFTLPNGVKFDLKGRSLFGTAMRQIFAQFIVPLLEYTAEKVGVTLPKRIKHSDIIEYCVNSYYTIFLEALKDSELQLTDAPYVDEIRQISDFNLTREVPDIVDSVVLLPHIRE